MTPKDDYEVLAETLGNSGSDRLRKIIAYDTGASKDGRCPARYTG